MDLINEIFVGANGRSPLHYGHSPLHSGNGKNAIPPMKPRSISSLIAGFKSATTKQININRNTPKAPVWQRNYYDRIIRHEAALEKIRQYVQTNPLSWNVDQLHPHNPSKW
ncbi:transposase [Nostoc sp. LEGE 06077]|uniref:transposase n=1 Tax=Nostoc sp. LEGE 06077 TaxID=915325 RepID=UPI002AD30382|nr:transposase [Nostoc sp. LEGE 06077]